MTGGGRRTLTAGGRTRLAATALVLAGAGTAVAVNVPGAGAGTRSAPASSVPRGWPTAKAARLRAENRLRQAAARRPLRPPPALPGPRPGRAVSGPRLQDAGGTVTAPSSQAGLSAGIVGLEAGGPFRPSRFSGTNLWNGPVGGRWEVVQAGGTPSGRAGVYVYSRSQDPDSGAPPRVTGIRVPPSGPRGRFTVRQSSADTLVLAVPGSGRVYRFNVVSLCFG